ncbi:site-specific integrase [Arthrobacter sp. H5]|uniref:tyrosine-type recombinase/integrase n=1 Tax=Arthrobacter sp. H5 TaxID=1267973 RepID=UPI0012DE8430|nr:site-specific integrase [Arthrobacter sp. H5]
MREFSEADYREAEAHSKASALEEDPPFSTVVESYSAHIETSERRPSTIYEYIRACRKDILPSLGSIPASELDVRACAKFLHSLIDGDRLYRKAGSLRALLSAICQHGAGMGLMKTNPVRDVARLPTRRAGEVKVIEAGDVSILLAAARRYFSEPPNRPGPKVNRDLPDGLEILCATGIRISELLALRYADVCIDGPEVEHSITLTGSVRWEKGHGIVRRLYTKSSDDHFTIPIGVQMAATLRQRRDTEIAPNPHGALFPSRGGGWVDPGNWRSRWRRARADIGVMFELPADLDLGTITPHTFRRTVATYLRDEVDRKAAQLTLNHSSDTITARYYFTRSKEAPDHARLLDALVYGDAREQ